MMVFNKWVLLMCMFTVGNYLGDSETLKDCASKGEARMLGGGTITCEVKRETK